jgi:hypothetical protein
MTELKNMDVWKLFEFVLDFPEYISDSYFRDLGRDIETRFKELKNESLRKTHSSST